MTTALLFVLAFACCILLAVVAVEIYVEHTADVDDVTRITDAWRPAHALGVAPGTDAQHAPARLVLTASGRPGRHRAELHADTGQLDLTELEALLEAGAA